MKRIPFFRLLIRFTMHLFQSLLITLSAGSLIVLVYFGLLTNFEDKYSYLFFSIGGLGIAGLLYYLTSLGQLKNQPVK
ncbi:hypothetical protein Xbed_02668 [Xenorhabdus beddingii]|uniref:Uncharacterized protein n=1 Tax=Xenorhabdus beddingii TaxID=40578 RepID=A0A1Y2SJT6_9GAMM|nr:hypothetical protein Xbed_02668 [Xenorhabdus beddingii]